MSKNKVANKKFQYHMMSGDDNQSFPITDRRVGILLDNVCRVSVSDEVCACKQNWRILERGKFVGHYITITLVCPCLCTEPALPLVETLRRGGGKACRCVDKYAAGVYAIIQDRCVPPSTTHKATIVTDT
ncbi:hypothetical protein J6590_031229 [Homalodisca vitripennis]|nr:hypothetical protein J6590_031229 [Homalodisca vitripennis]